MLRRLVRVAANALGSLTGPPGGRETALVRLVRCVVLLALASACGAPSAGPALPASAAAVALETCAPGDQDPYVYRPARLRVLAPCVRAVGTVVESSIEADGDVHLNVRLDAAYAGLLQPGNDFEGGVLIVEPVCQIPPLQADAIRVCAANPAPLARIPAVGDHVWLEGRYVVELQHHAWTELHPLYRWGAQ